jgi:hypothetical protein
MLEIGTQGAFQQCDDGFFSVGSCARRHGIFFGLTSTFPPSVIAPKTPRWQVRRMVPIQEGLFAAQLLYFRFSVEYQA